MIYLSTIYKSCNSVVELHTNGSKSYIVKKEKSGRSLRLQNEVRMLKQISHPNIIKLYRCDTVGSLCTLTFKYYMNGDLFDAIYSWGIPSNKRKIVYQLLDAITYLHDVLHIAHMDIKPENIVFDKHYNLVLIDFDRACDIGDYKGEQIGTKDYLPPESKTHHLKHKRCPQKQDVWCIGLVIHEMYFKSTKVDMALVAKCPDQILKKIMTRALEEDPCDRPTAQELMALLPRI